MVTCLLSGIKPVDKNALERAFRSLASPNGAQYGLTHTPDTPHDLSVGMEGIKSAAEIALQEPRTYAIARRTFLYIAYAEHTRRIFLPDHARIGHVDSILKHDGLFRERVLKALKYEWESHDAFEQTSIARLIPPLAAIVFDRASSDPRNIGPRILELRSETKALRTRLRESEAAIQTMTFAEAQEELDQWKTALISFKKTWGKRSILAETEGVVPIVSSFLKAVAKRTDFDAWVDFLSEFKPTQLKRMLAPRPVVHFRRLLRKRVPSKDRLHGSVTELFGTIEV